MLKLAAATLCVVALLLSASPAAAAGRNLTITNPCAAFPTCQDCVSASIGCGWCSYPIIYEGGQTGPQCAGTSAQTTPFTCPAIFSRFTCVQGYVCQNNQCVLGQPGQGTTKAQCEQTCSGGTPAPMAKVYSCNQATKTCSPAAPGTPGSASLPICEAACQNISTAVPGPVQKTYLCNLTTFTCDPTTPGHGASQEVCEETCNKQNIGYDCNFTSGQCFMVQQGGSSQSACEAACGKNSNTPLPTLPPAPGPPPEYVGTWRGVEIQNNYRILEWDLLINHTEVIIVQNIKGNRVVQYGQPFHTRNSAQLEFWILITAGPDAGKYIRTIGDATGERGPQNNFITLAMSPAGGTTPKTITDAMTNGIDRVLALEDCIVGDPYCYFALPPGVGAAARHAEEPRAMVQERIQRALLAAEVKAFSRKSKQHFVAAKEKSAFVDNCTQYAATCQTCIANRACGWCSVPVQYTTGQTGTQCAGTSPGTTPFICQGTYSTTGCEVGYYCESGSFQCQVAQPGNGAPLAQCQATCKPTPPPNPKVPQYTCNLATHQCQLCRADHCPGSMPQGQCEQLCAHPRPAPTPDMVGVWRGVYIQQGYAIGEIDLVLNNTGAFFYIDGAQYFTASVISLGADLMLWTVQTGPTALVGKQLGVLYQMASVDRGLYWQGTFGLGLPNGGFPSDYNTPMYTKGMQEMVLAKCLEAPCQFNAPGL